MTEMEQEKRASLHADVMLRRALDLRAKNNVLIAEFMGVKSYEASGYTNFVYSEDNHRTEVDLAYHDSWDWLMPVVEKIDEVSDENTLFKVEHNRAFVEDIENYHIFIDVIASSRLEATYKAVVEFINQLNK
jgi:hypothetical protein